MIKFNNTHIFTGYLKQLLSSFNLPVCRVYTKEFAEYFKQHGKEDPRVIESFDNIVYLKNNKSKLRISTRVNYLKGAELYNYLWEFSQDKPEMGHKNSSWKRVSSIFYDSNKSIPGLTRVLHSPGNIYDSATHEHLGEYLRFLRDYYNINLMSLYNCFNNKICNNIYYPYSIKTLNPNFDPTQEVSKNNSKYKETAVSLFDSQDSEYRIYALPVKLFADYTIAIDCHQGLEMFCGLYTTTLDESDKGKALIEKTYHKINRALFNQPFVYDKLNVKYWNFLKETQLSTTPDSSNYNYPVFMDSTNITRWDIANREQDLKLFIKVPASCKSSITILEGDFRNFNDTSFAPVTYTKQKADGTLTTQTVWEYRQNHTVINFGDKADIANGLDINASAFTPIGKLQLLALNTNESYPFSDRLVEYLCGSMITPGDEISDNIKRAQKVMSQNQHFFKIEGLWEDKMQKIVYDYLMNTGPIHAVPVLDEQNNPVPVKGKLILDGQHKAQYEPGNNKRVLVQLDNENKTSYVDIKVKLHDSRLGLHPGLGHTSKSYLYDVLGYVDKETEKWYASWKIENGNAKVKDSIQNVDIYNGLYDI